MIVQRWALRSACTAPAAVTLGHCQRLSVVSARSMLNARSPWSVTLMQAQSSSDVSEVRLLPAPMSSCISAAVE